MAELGIMIEGQEGLTWERWRALCREVESLGFASLRRSDHLFSVMGEPRRDCIDCWTSLALAAEWTSRIELGPMVSPLTWHVPAVLARQAAAVDILSGGRLILGVGAGWHVAEHEAFGVPFPSTGRRFDNLERGIELIERAWQTSNPKPVRGGRIPLLIGGGGEKRSIPLAARVASEWNLSALEPDVYRAKSHLLDEECRKIGRDPAQIRRSVMATILVGRSERDVLDRAGRLGQFLPRLRGLAPREVVAAIGSRGLAGTVEQVVERCREGMRSGVQLFLLQHFLMDDTDALRVLAEEVAPAIREAG